jgi:hypothetical protein
MTDGLLDTSQPTTIELDALDETRLIEVPVERPSLDDLEVDHDAQGGWPQYTGRDHDDFDHTGEEVADQDRVEQDRAERGLDL